MAEITIFEDDAFSVTNLLTVINEEHVVPGQIAAAGLFEEQGSTTVTQQIEKDGMTLRLVEAKPRGGVPQVVTGDKRKMIPFNTVHLPETFSIYADEIQGIRAFGSRTELQSAEAVVAARIRKCRLQMELTHEYQRIGAIKGLVLDADGTTELLDIYHAFGIKRPVAFSLGLDKPDTDVSVVLTEVLDKQETALGTTPSSTSRGYAGKEFWAKLIAHKNVRETYLNTQQAAALRGDRRGTFEFGGVIWERYKGQLGAKHFVDPKEAHIVPEGVPGLFITAFAPADYMETVNTLGLPFYSKLERMPYDKGIAGEAQSNPLHLCTKPLAVRTVTI
ncbi:major capsid protein E [Pseudomonas sp. PA1(2017)]|uniref:major capsid protein n=1 Tax=Pseudomonas sp. PA1(2017) TaxID=1932113 RepID=UPI00095EF094|nr:major capsid protein [Pseudomonas sp. PA1(2017)]OLU15335.1 major capsid protein E [Pseudomonas sp. PA1(2017)]